MLDEVLTAQSIQYLKSFLDLHEHMLEEKLYEKQYLIKERHIRKLYRQGIHERSVLGYEKTFSSQHASVNS